MLHRGHLVRDLAYIERKKYIALGRHFKLGKADRMVPT